LLVAACGVALVLAVPAPAAAGRPSADTTFFIPLPNPGDMTLARVQVRVTAGGSARVPLPLVAVATRGARRFLAARDVTAAASAGRTNRRGTRVTGLVALFRDTVTSPAVARAAGADPERARMRVTVRLPRGASSLRFTASVTPMPNLVEASGASPQMVASGGSCSQATLDRFDRAAARAPRRTLLDAAELNPRFGTNRLVSAAVREACDLPYSYRDQLLAMMGR
jgi:hypothetical protein